jgi:hypothetical protein
MARNEELIERAPEQIASHIGCVFQELPSLPVDDQGPPCREIVVEIQNVVGDLLRIGADKISR